MRIWTLHPKYLDTKGLVALWREVLLAQAVLIEQTRGYHFDASKIATRRHEGKIATARGQLDYEWAHLKAKLRVRAPDVLAGLKDIERPTPHPLFRIVPGGVADWEVVAASASRS